MKTLEAKDTIQDVTIKAGVYNGTPFCDASFQGHTIPMRRLVMGDTIGGKKVSLQLWNSLQAWALENSEWDAVPYSGY